MSARRESADAVAELGRLEAHALAARVDEVDGQTGVVLGDGDGMVELSEAFGRAPEIAGRYEAVAALLLERAADLKRPPIPDNPRPGDLGVPAHWI